MLIGFIVNIGSKLLDNAGMISLPVYMDPFILGFFSNIISILVISRFTKPTAAALAYFVAIRQTPKEEVDPIEVKKTLIGPVVIMPYSVWVC